MKIYKSLLFMLTILMIIFVFVACGKSSKLNSESEAQSTKATPASEVSQSNMDATEQTSNTDKTEAKEVENGVSLPEGYPSEFVPVMEDAVSGWGLGSGGGFNLSYTTPSSADKVLEFYTDYFKKYGDDVKIADNKREINLEADGKKANIIIDDLGNSTSLRISISSMDTGNNGEGDMENNTVSDDSSSDSIEGGEFPVDIIPIIDGGEILDQSSEKQDDGIQYSITYQVNNPLSDVAEFYKKIINSMTDTYIEDGDDEFFATAVKENSTIEIQIINGGSKDCTVLINVNSR